MVGMKSTPHIHLRNGYNAISKFCHESREPVFITRNGQGDLAIMSIEVYEEITKKKSFSIEDSKDELYRLLAKGRTDAISGCTRPHKEVMADLRKKIINSEI